MRFSVFHLLSLVILAAAAPIDGNSLVARQAPRGEAVTSDLSDDAGALLQAVVGVGSPESSMYSDT
jgi:hypothetical protein